MACAEPNVPHLFSPAGFLDDTWWHRTYWLVGTRMATGYGGWPRMGNKVPSGRLLVCDGSTVYGYGRDKYARHGSHPGLGKTHYRLFSCARETGAPGEPDRKNKKEAGEKDKFEYHWSEHIGLQARAMVLADKNLFVAGPADLFDGREGALLWAVSAEDGQRLAEYELDSTPVFDGMAAAKGRLYISMKNGRIMSLEGE